MNALRRYLGLAIITIGYVWCLGVLALFAADWLNLYQSAAVEFFREVHSWIPIFNRTWIVPWLIPALPGVFVIWLGVLVKGESL